MGMISVGDAVGRVLGELGVAHVFAVVGSGNFHVTNAMIDAGAGFTAARHEMGAACMADAYSRATGRVSVVSVHQGCGLTNALTGIAEAAKCHTPVLVVTGDTAAGHVTSNFYIDQDSAVAAIGAVPMRIHSAKSAVADARDAFATALLERRTVVLSLPVDLQDELIDDATLAGLTLPERLASGASPEAVARVAERLLSAERPIIVGGRGAWSASAELRSLAEASGALLVTSGAGRGLFVGDEWALDIMGGFSTPGAAELITEADLLVVFGAALNDWTARGGMLTRNAEIVQIDDRHEAFGLHRSVSLEVLGDTALVAAAVDASLRAAGAPRTGYRTPDVHGRVRAARYWSEQPLDDTTGDGLVDPAALTNAIDQLVPMERIVIPDGGNVNCYPGAHLRVPDQQGYCLPLSFQAIGLGLASAIGAAVSQPDRIPVLGVGDGAFMMSAVELDTAVRLELGMLIVVYNDSAYGAEIHLFPGYEDKQDIVRFPETDLAAIARGYGCEAATVRSLDDLDVVRTWLAGPRNRPLVLDAKISGAPSWMMQHGHDFGSHAESAD